MKLENALRNLKRPPANFDGAIGVELGKLLEVQVEDLVVKFGDPPKLIWFVAQKSLGWFTGIKLPRASKSAWNTLREESGARKAENAFEAWSDRGVEQAKTMSFPTTSSKWSRAKGHAKRIDYWSDKWGDSQEYTHDFGTSISLYRFVHRKSRGRGPVPNLWVVRGGRLTVTERGIVG